MDDQDRELVRLLTRCTDLSERSRVIAERCAEESAHLRGLLRRCAEACADSDRLCGRPWLLAGAGPRGRHTR